jgi:hypothetical protein
MVHKSGKTINVCHSKDKENQSFSIFVVSEASFGQFLAILVNLFSRSKSFSIFAAKKSLITDL